MNTEKLTLNEIVSLYEPIVMDSKSSVSEAVREMDRRKASAVAVVASGILYGVFTHRDLMYRVVGCKRNPLFTTLAEVMTTSVKTMSPDDSAYDAFVYMGRNNLSHIPIVENGQFLGLVSDDDLRREIAMDLKEFKDGFYALESYMGGEAYVRVTHF
jgi:CBS domain-containing protein